MPSGVHLLCAHPHTQTAEMGREWTLKSDLHRSIRSLAGSRQRTLCISISSAVAGGGAGG